VINAIAVRTFLFSPVLTNYIWCRILLRETRARNHQVANVNEARVVYPPGTDHNALEVLAETIGEVTDISSTY